MSVYFYKFLILILSIFCCLLVAGENSVKRTVLNSVDDTVLLDKSLFLYEDKTNSLTIHDIQKKSYDQKFKLSKIEAPSYGITNSTIWVKIIIKNKTKETNWVLKNDVVWHDYFDFFSMDEGRLKIIKTGDRRAFKTRDLKYRGFAFNISPKENSIYYFKIKSKDDLSLGTEILSLKKFLKDEKEVMIVYALFYVP